MIKNYLRVAFRNLWKNKVYVIINTLGLGIAMACCLTAYLLIAYNIEFDNYFEDDQVRNVVKVLHHFDTSVGKRDQELVCPVVMAPLAAQEVSGIEDFTRFCNDDGILSHGENSFRENIRFADSSFFRMFSLGFKFGSEKNFENQQSIFLSEQLSRKYFAEKNPVGETLTLELNGKKYETVVGGVFEKLPLNLSFNIDAMMRIETYLDAYSIGSDRWDMSISSSVLFKLSDIEQRFTVGQQMGKYVQLTNDKRRESKTISYELIPFTTPIKNGEVSRSSLRLPIPTVALFIFSTLGVIILLIACFNLTNTTLALTGKRLKEIGVRKVVGSGRTQIALQFLLEMAITISLAIVAGLLMAQVIVPQFAVMWQLQYGLSDLNGLNLTVTLVILLFCAAILAGIYPALFNSKFTPLTLLKGGQRIKGTTPLTRMLLVVQFSLSVIVFVAGIIFTQNASYQKNISLGYDKESILAISVQGEQEYNRLKDKIDRNPKIEAIAGARNHIGPYTAYYKPVKLDTTIFETNIYEVGSNYFRTVGLEMESGRDFSEGSQIDYESAAIIDSNFAANHQLTNPLDAQIWYEGRPYRVIGVVGNHLSGLKQHDDSEHFYTLSSPSKYGVMILRANPKDLLTVRSYVEAEWKKTFLGKPFQSSLQEDIVYDEAGEYNNNLMQILLFLTILGCLLSASGIYALASLNVQRRTKEIGVRKVLGASVSSVIKLVNSDFAIVLGVAAVVGGVSGYFLTNALLNSLYVQHIEVGFVTVSLCGFVIFIIGIATTTGTIFKAALTNPTETLRNE
jgi:putative ABC transport system permease protein